MLRWGTDEDVRGEVHYGLQSGQLDKVEVETEASRDHRVSLRGLQAATRYYYRIKHHDQWWQQAEWFYTSPEPERQLSTRVLVLGDPGYASMIQSNVRDSALRWLQQHRRPGRAYLDMLLTTGDNAYTRGTNAEFDRNFFQPYKNILKNIPVWTVLGNHDARRWSFYKIFDSPEKGQAGGLASGDRAYYSFDYSQTHFVVLDSHHGDTSPGSTMLNWLALDLKRNKQPWTVVLFHQPPYTKSTHDSDSIRDSRGRMVRVRQNVLPILEKAGVDLVLSGHSHAYERSYLLACHYGTSDTLADWMQQSSRTTSSKLASVYVKPGDGGQASFTGTLYMVVGSSAKVDSVQLDHPAMPVSLAQTGSVILEINQGILSAIFLNEDGEISDQFSIQKDKKVKPASFESCSKRQAYYQSK